MLKWMGKKAHAWINDMFDHELKSFSFMTVDICIGQVRNCPRNIGDLQGLKTKMLKWMGIEAHAWITYLFNHALQNGTPYD